MKHLLLTAFFALLLFASPAFAKPNVVLTLVDDMGYSDLGKERNELTDLSNERPEFLQQMQARCKAWRNSMPTFENVQAV